MSSEKSKSKAALPTPIKGQVVRVNNRGGRDGYRRAGVQHPKGETDHAFGAFDQERLNQLAADPKLDVRVIDAPAKAAAEK